MDWTKTQDGTSMYLYILCRVYRGGKDSLTEYKELFRSRNPTVITEKTLFSRSWLTDSTQKSVMVNGLYT